MFALDRYDQNCTRITKDGAIVALIERLANDRWKIFQNEKAVSAQTFSTVKQAFAWWTENNPA